MDATDAAPPTHALEIEESFRQIMDATGAAPHTQALEVEESFRQIMNATGAAPRTQASEVESFRQIMDETDAVPPTQASEVESFRQIMDETDAVPPTQASEVESFRQIMDETEAADAAPPAQASEAEEPLSARMAHFRAQMEQVIHYKKTRSHVPGLTHNQRQTVLRQAKTYVRSGGKLYYIGGKKKLAQEVITSEDRVREVFHQYHSNDTGGHHGMVTTRSKISLHYFWRNMCMDIDEFVKNCATCQMNQPQPQPEPDLMSIINNRQTPPCKRKTPRKRKAKTVDRGTMYTPSTEAQISAEDIDTLISAVDMDMQTSAIDKKMQTSAADKKTQTSAVDKKTQTSAVDKETQTSAVETQRRPEQRELMGENEHFWKSLLPSMMQLDKVENLQFRIDVEHLMLTYLSQSCARRTTAVSSVAPQASCAAFPAACNQNMGMDHSCFGQTGNRKAGIGGLVYVVSGSHTHPHHTG